MMQTQIPSGLQALMQASQILSTQASPTAPGPQGQQPTVAGRVNEQIKQAAQPQQPQQPPEGGIASLNPSMREMGQQAGVAGQIMAQRQAQQQQQAQDPQAVAQMAAQMLQSKGVAGLPANMGFKEGGIIGYAGPDGSDVKKPADSLVEAQQKLIAATKSGDAQAAQFYAKQVAELRQQITSEPAGSPGELVAEPMAPQGTRAMPDKTPTLGETARARLNEILQGGISSPKLAPEGAGYAAVKALANMIPAGLPEGSGIEQFRTSFADKKEDRPARVAVDPTQLEGYGVKASAPLMPERREAPPAAPTRAVQPAAQQKTALTGIATTIPETKINASGIVEPTIDSLTADIDKLAPKRAEAFNKDAAADEEKRAQLKASFADLNAKEIKALEADKAARKQLAASKAERDQFNRVQSFFRDLYTRGDSYGTVQAGIFAREEAERLADLNHNKAVILLERAQQAEKLGDMDRAAALKKEAYARLGQEDKNRSDAAKISGELANSRYGQKMETARTQGQIDSANARTQADIDQRNRQLMANLAIEERKLAGLSEERRNSKQGQALTAALGRLNDATRNLTKVQDDNKVNLAMKDQKDPTAQSMYKQAEKNVSVAQSTYDDAKQVFDTISAEALKGYATTAAPGTASKNDPLGLRKK